MSKQPESDEGKLLGGILIVLVVGVLVWSMMKDKVDAENEVVQQANWEQMK